MVMMRNLPNISNQNRPFRGSAHQNMPIPSIAPPQKCPNRACGTVGANWKTAEFCKIVAWKLLGRLIRLMCCFYKFRHQDGCDLRMAACCVLDMAARMDINTDRWGKKWSAVAFWENIRHQPRQSNAGCAQTPMMAARYYNITRLSYFSAN